MKKNDVEIGAAYVAKVSGRLTRVRIAGISPHGGWNAVNVETGRAVRIRTAGRLRRALDGKATKAVAAADQHNARLRDERERSPDGMTASERAMAQSAVAPVQAPAADEASAAAGDPDVCATVGCDRPAALTYLGRPRCQECYADEVDDGDETSIENPNDEEIDMATKTKATKITKKASKAGKTAKATKPAPASTKAAAAKSVTEKPVAPPMDAKPKRVSALDAAAEVLKQAGKPMRAGEMIVAMAEQGLWSSPAGKTPHATLYAAILREIGTKGGEARFRKVERGQFEYTG